MTDTTLGLGTIFTGQVDATFRKAVEDLRKIVDVLGKAQKEASSSTSKSEAATAKAAKKTREYANELDNVGKKLSYVHGGMQRLTQAMKVVASYSLAGTAVFTLVNALKEGAKGIVEFDQALKNIQAITGASDREIVALDATIRKVASTTKYSVTEVSDAVVLLGQAGLDASESVAAIESVALLATGTLSTMADSADLITTALRAWNLDAAESGRIADIFATAVNKSKLTIDKLRIAFNYLGPVAKAAHIDVEEVAASTMILANSGIRASTIGTGLRQVISRLVAPTTKLKEAFVAAGADMIKINPIYSDFQSVLEELIKVVPNAQKAFELFGLRGAVPVAALVNAGIDRWKKYRDEVYNVGQAQAMANKQMEGLGVLLKNLLDKLGLLAIKIGEGGLAASFRLLLQILRPMFDLFTILAGTLIGKLIIGFTALTTAIFAVGMALKYMNFQLMATLTGTNLEIVSRYAARFGVWAVVTRNLSGLLDGVWKILGLIGGTPVGRIALVVTAFLLWADHLRQVRDELEVTSIEQEKHTKRLEAFRNTLNEVSSDTMEYKSTIRRLASEYPELADKIDIVKGAWRDNGKALEEAIGKKNQEHLRTLTQLVNEYAKATFKAKLLSSVFGDTIQTWGDLAKKSGKDTLWVLNEMWDQFKKDLPLGRQGEQLWDWVTKKAEEFAETWGESGAKVRAYTTLQEDAIGKIAYQLKDGLGLNASLDEIETKIRQLFPKANDAEVERYTLLVKKSFREMAQEVAKAEKGVDGLSGAWKKAYEEAGSRKEQKAIVEMANAYYKEFSKIVQDVADMQLSEVESTALMNARKAKLDEDYTKKLKETLDKEIKLRDEPTEALQRTMAEMQRVRWAALGEEQKAEEEAARERGRRRAEQIAEEAKTDAERKQLLMENEDTTDMELFGIAEKYRQKKEEEDKKAAEKAQKEQEKQNKERLKLARENMKALDKLSELDVKEVEIRQGPIAGLEKEIQLLKEKREVLLTMPLAEDETELDRKVALRENEIDTLESEKKLAEETKKLRKAAFQKQLGDARKFSDEYNTIMARGSEAGYITAKEYIEYLADLQKNKMEEAEILYKDGAISAAAYFKVIEEGYKKGVIKTEEFKKKQLELQGTWRENLKYGLTEAKRDAKSWNQTMQEIGKDLPIEAVNEMTSSLMDWIDGTKKAGEAFAEFGKDTVKWLMEIIIKQTLLNALGFGTSGGGGIFKALFGHGGGVMGKDTFSRKMVDPSMFAFAPRYHEGRFPTLQPDEEAAVIRKDETIFTPQQMKALKGMMSVKLDLKTTNIVDPRAVDAWLSSPEGANSQMNFIAANAYSIRRVLNLSGRR